MASIKVIKVGCVISQAKRTISVLILTGSISSLAFTACSPSVPSEIEASMKTEAPVEEKNYTNNLLSAVAQFEIEFGDFYLSIGDLTEELLTDFLENSEDANKGYLAAIKRIRSISDSTDDFFLLGTEIKHLTSDEFDKNISEADKVQIQELNPLVVDSMELVTEFLQVARDAATALSIVDKTAWVSLQDDLVEIAQKYYDTGIARGRLYQSLGENLENESLRALFFELGQIY